MRDNHSAVEGLALKQAMASSRTMLRWCHSGVNVADGMTKVATSSLELLRHFVRADAWQLVVDPEFTSYR
eukprot:12937368-Prorocentrum_lima.AAC.1